MEEIGRKSKRSDTHKRQTRTSPIKLELATRICLSNVRGGFRAQAAFHVGVRRALDRADVVDLADHAWLGTGAGHVALVLFAVDEHAVHDPVCRD